MKTIVFTNDSVQFTLFFVSYTLLLSLSRVVFHLLYHYIIHYQFHECCFICCIILLNIIIITSGVSFVVELIPLFSIIKACKWTENHVRNVTAKNINITGDFVGFFQDINSSFVSLFRFFTRNMKL